MADAAREILEEIARFGIECRTRREVLLEVGSLQEKNHRRLTFAAGVLALISACAGTSVFIDLTNSTFIKVISALLGFGSGLLTLLISVFNDPKESTQILLGAAEYLKLSDSCANELIGSNISETAGKETLKQITLEYYGLASKYDRYRGPAKSRARPVFAEYQRKLDAALLSHSSDASSTNNKD